MKKLFCAIICLCMLASFMFLSGCESQNGTAVDKTSIFRGLDADEMFICSYLAPWPEYKRDGEVIWNGLEDATAFQYLKEAGLNYVGDNNMSFGGSTYEYAKRSLELAEEAGMMYMMAAYDVIKMDGEILGTDEQIKSKLQEMYQYDSFGGFYFRDEPYTYMFPHIQKCLEDI